MNLKIHRRKFRDISVTVMLEGTLELTTSWLFPGIPVEQLREEVQLIDKSTVLASMNIILVEYKNRKILCDTGLGEFIPERKMYDEYFSLNQFSPVDRLLQEIPVSAEAITDVVITHTDFDHCFGITKKTGKETQLRFPNATHWLHALEHQHVIETDQPDDLPSRSEVLAARKSGNLRLSKDGTTISDGFNLRHTPGHSPGHQVLEVSTQNQYFIVCGDLFHHPANIRHPDWCPGYADKIALIQSREKVITEVKKKRGTLFTSHFPFPGYGKVAINNSRDPWLPYEN